MLSAEIPERFRQLLTTRPAAPVAPTDFEPWPLRSWQTEVVRRAEFIVEGVEVGPTLGSNPNSQNATRPREVPHNASAFCEVAAGVLFTSEPSVPMNMLVSQNAPEIKAFVADCELVSMKDYLRRHSV